MTSPDQKAREIAYSVVPEYKTGKYSCTGVYAKRYNAAYEAAMIALSSQDYEELFEALMAVIARSHNGDMGSSKVIDMRKIAESAIEQVKGEQR